MIFKKEIMRKICSSETLIEALTVFSQNRELLKDCKFIFSVDGDLNLPEFILHKTFSDNDTAGIYSIFNYSKIVVLDEYIYSEMLKNGTVTYGVDYSISLDSNTVSYIDKLMKNQSIPASFIEIFMFLAQKEVNIDPMPYILENAQKINMVDHVDDILDTLKAYQILKTMDVEYLVRSGKARSIYTNEEINSEAIMILEDMKRLSSDPKLKSIFKMQKLKYCLLLKMTLIQFSNPSKSSGHKLIEFVEFCHSVFNTMFLREIVIAKAYFEYGQNLGFFGKVQKKQKDLLRVLKNMSWDLYHISKMEENISMPPEGGARYYFPAFLTFDKRLIDIIRLYSLRAIGFTLDGKVVTPAYDVTDFNRTIDPKYGIQRYFEESAIRKRDLNRDVNLNMECIIDGLENSISSYL